MHNTIFALATGPEKSALSIIRISGKFSRIILKKMTLKELPQERTLTLRSFYFPIGKKRLIDKCLFVLVNTVCSPIYFLLLNIFLIVPSFQTLLSVLGG